MVIGNILMLNNRVIIDGVEHSLVQIPEGLCSGCAFDVEDGMTCEDIPSTAKELCVPYGAIWQKIIK